MSENEKPELDLDKDDFDFPDDENIGWDLDYTVDPEFPDEPPAQWYEGESYHRVMVGPGEYTFFDICCWFNSRIPTGYVVVGTPFRSRHYWVLRLREE